MTEAVSYFSALGFLQMVGVAGFLAYILGFASVQMGWMDGNGPAYSACNIVAATLVGLSLFAEFNLSSALIQISWIVIGCIGLFRRLRRPQTQAGPVTPYKNWSDAL